MTAQQISQLLHTWQGRGYAANPAFPMAGPQATQLLPSFNPQMATALAGNYWNRPDMVPKAPIMASQKPNLLPQVQVANQGQDFVPGVAPQGDGGIAALLKAFTAPHGHHFGIGGAEISDTNPYGNPGGDPFKNGFFKPSVPTPGMSYLAGTTRPDQGQIDLLNMSAQAHRQPQAGVNFIPQQGAVASVGSPVWQQQNPGFNPFSDANWGQVPGTTAQSNLRNKQAFWSAMGM